MKILIFGSSGMLGRYVCNILKNDYEVSCITRKDFDIENEDWCKLNNIVNNMLVKDDIIINCAGIIPQKTEHSDYKNYIRVNTLFPHKLNDIALKHNYKFIHITTDCVFNGSKGNYTNTDKHTANTIYGISKSLGEPEEATVIRTSIIGEEILGKKSFIEWVISNKQKQINGFTNHYWNGVTCLTLAKIIKKIIKENLYWNGIKHIFSPDIASKYDLCKYVNEIYDLNIDIISKNDDIAKNMTLNGDDFLFEIDTIYNQITEQQKYFI